MQQTMVMLPGEQFKQDLAKEVAELVLARMNNLPATSPQNDDFLTTSEVLRFLRITAPTLRKLRRSGKVRTYGEGTHHHRFRRSEIEEALAKM